VRVVLYGTRADGHAKVCLELIEELADWTCVGCLDDVPANRGNRLHGLSVLGGRERLATLGSEGVDGVVLGFGAGAERLVVLRAAEAAGLHVPPLVHPAASVAPSARIADGAVVLRGALVGDDCAVGEAALVNMGAILTHDVVLGPGVNIGPGAIFAGRCTVEANAQIGAGATLVPDAAVGPGATVGAGAVVLGTVEAATTVLGVPARPSVAASPSSG
jgi:UDP-perosamine 4-acetyltransferase